ncbi:MAG: 5-(carboxyamino)imidazole ribonucleotide synthase [Sphingobacteriales bacterium]|nr:MAG: 5-(carboxyamino)imidazole ribonucleotide synthase [Sphingobacteriales bacterium]
MFTDLKVGILGGGQLGAMLLRHAIDLGLNVKIMDKDDSAPAARYSAFFQPGSPASFDDVLAFGKNVDVLTIEMENVNTDALKQLEKSGVKVYPSPNIIETIKDKSIQKQFLQSNNIPVVPGITVFNKEDLRAHADMLPGCLKKCNGGYDGYGVMMIESEKDIDQAFDEPSVLEKKVDIKHEIAVIVSRDIYGTVECYDPVMMVFDKVRNILEYQLCPAGLSHDKSMECISLAIKIAEALKLVGILAVEMFITAEDTVLVNELAPRPHNSGHHTIEACTTSQYEQLIRAIVGMPLGATSLIMPNAMVNILEPAGATKQGMENALHKILSLENAHLHWYGKESGRAGRKMGHVTITENTMELAMSKAIKIRQILKNINE